MRVLIIKTSSLGDIIHTLPAINDALAVCPKIRFDWVVEEAFAEIPAWHHGVDQVFPIAIRRWRKTPLKSLRSEEFKAFCRALKQQPYDLIIDAQGLLKSAWIGFLAEGERHGYDRHSARESIATCFYQRKHAVAKEQHAVERIRQLFAASLAYGVPANRGYCGIDKTQFQSTGSESSAAHVVFLHGTTRDDKHWPESYWRSLCEQVVSKGYQVMLPWGNEQEHRRAQSISDGIVGAQVLPKLNLAGVASYIASAAAVVAVDTGLGHLSAGFDVPCVSLYGPTEPGLIGAYGNNQVHLQAADYPQVDNAIEPAVFRSLLPDIVLSALIPLLKPTRK